MCAWFGRAAAELARQQLQARMEQLAGYNAHLIRQLSAALRTLRSERAASQAEIARLHQKVPRPCPHAASRFSSPFCSKNSVHVSNIFLCIDQVCISQHAPEKACRTFST